MNLPSQIRVALSLLLCFRATSRAFVPSQQFAAPRKAKCHADNSRWLTNNNVGTFSCPASLLPLTSAAASVDNVRTEEAQQQDASDETHQQQQEEEEEDPTETYQINIELSKLASRCARDGGGGRHYSKPHPAMVAHQLLQNMTYQDTVAYNTVLKAFAKSTPAMLVDTAATMATTSKGRASAAERAQKLLLEMVELHKAQKTANQDWYERNAQGQLADGELARGPPRVRVKPNVRSFSTVMDAWSRAGNVKGCLRVLKALEDRYEQSGQDVALQPNIFSYNTVLSAYAKSKGGRQGAEDCQAFLDNMPVDADVISYNSCLHAWARSGVSDAGERAEDVLRNMSVEANVRSYTTVMDAWSRSRETGGGGTASPAVQAHALLDELKDDYERTGDRSIKPNCFTYSTVINAYAMSKEAFKAQRAFELLQEMRALGNTDTNVLPNTVTYNSVLNACATSSPLSYTKLEEDGQDGDDKPTCCLQEMIQTLYNQLLLGHSSTISSTVSDDAPQSNTRNNNKNNERKGRPLAPDHFTFGTVLKACTNNIFWDDPGFGIQVFQEACRQGQVSLGVLVQLRQAVTIPVFQELLPEGAYNIKTKQFNMAGIPDKWKQNVRGRERDGGGSSSSSSGRRNRHSK